MKWVHIPIVDQRGTGDKVAEEAISDLLEKAAAILADPDNYPVFFHCHHGLNRTSMVQIAYRTKYCGWTLEQAADEIERTVGLVKVNHGPDYRHMVTFYETRVLPVPQQESPVPKRPLRWHSKTRLHEQRSSYPTGDRSWCLFVHEEALLDSETIATTMKN